MRSRPIKTWNVREILDMSKLLVNQKDCNPDISKWDVSLATSFVRIITLMSSVSSI